jgi:hypothetical protein
MWSATEDVGEMHHGTSAQTTAAFSTALPTFRHWTLKLETKVNQGQTIRIAGTYSCLGDTSPSTRWRRGETVSHGRVTADLRRETELP